MAYVGPYRGGWRAQLQKDGVKVSKTFKLKRDALVWVSEQESKRTLHQHGFRAMTERYLLEVSSKKLSGKQEERMCASLLRHFGDVDLAEIDSPQIAAWRDERLKKVSSASVLREVNLLRNMFKVAQNEWRWIEHYPFRGVKLPKAGEPRTAIWTWQLIKRVLRAPRSGKTKEMQDAFHIALRTGMRLGEILAAPQNFNPKTRVVTLVNVPGARKTDAVYRIPIGRIAAKLLVRPEFTVKQNEGSVAFGKLCRELMIDGLHFHDARATALTHLAKKVDVLTLAKISRHKNVNLLSAVYYRETADQIAARI